MQYVVCFGGDAMYEESGPVYRVVGPFSSEHEAEIFGGAMGSVLELERPPASNGEDDG